MGRKREKGMKIEVHAQTNEYPTNINTASAIINYFMIESANSRYDCFSDLKEVHDYIGVFIKSREEFEQKNAQMGNVAFRVESEE